MLKLHDERGSVTAVVAAALVALLGFSGLAVDAGRLYAERQHLETIAEAAALAGARHLPEDPNAARQAALAYIRANHPDPLAEEVVEITPDGTGVRVRLADRVSLTLVRVLGLDDAAVAAGATARTAPLGGAQGVVPLGVEAADFQVGEQYLLKLGAGASQHGNYHAVALGGTGAANYRKNLREGYPGWLHVGETIETETGNMKGPTVDGLSERIAADPHATWDTVTVTSPRLLLVPVIEGFDQAKGRDEVTIVGFAVFFLEEVRPNGEVVGRFLDVAVDGRRSDPSGEMPAYAARVVYLTQ